MENTMKKFVASIKKILESYSYFMKLQWRLDRMGILLVVLPRLLRVLNAFIVVIFPGLILDSLVEGRQEQCVLYIAAFALYEFLDASIEALFTRAGNIHQEIFSARLNHMLVEKTTTLRQEQLEHPKVFEQYELARKCGEENSIFGYLGDTASIVFGLAELWGYLYLLREMSLWVLGFLVAVVAIHVAVQRRIDKNTMEESELDTPMERMIYYLNYQLMDPEYGKEIRMFDLKGFLTEKQAHVREEYYVLLRKYGKSRVRAVGLTNMAGSVLSLVFYASAILRFAMGALTVGAFTVTVNAMFRFSEGVRNVASLAVGYQMKAERLSHVRTFLDMTSAHTGTEEAEGFERGMTVEFVHVSYRYPGSENYALEDVSLRIGCGEKVSIVGPNGAGKSTFIGLMLGLYRPTSGKILYNGRDIEELDYDSYKKLFAVLPQDYQIFSFSILENILFTEQPSEAETVAAMESLDKAGLKEVVEKLPKRERTYLTQQFDPEGVALSGGEAQKLAIARVLYRDSAVFILDEPTAALSPRSEHDIYQRFAQVTEGKTVFLISHRLSGSRLCGRILVFQAGRLVEDGSHEALMQDGLLYAEMYAKQAEWYT